MVTRILLLAVAATAGYIASRLASEAFAPEITND